MKKATLCEKSSMIDLAVKSLTYQCSCSSLDYKLSDQSLRLFGVPSEFVTQRTSEKNKRGVRYNEKEFATGAIK